MAIDPVPSDGEPLSWSRIAAHVWNVYDSGAMLITCAWCSRIVVEDQWIAAPSGVLSTIDESTTMSHSICPDCAENLVRAPLAHTESQMGPPGFEPGTKGL